MDTAANHSCGTLPLEFSQGSLALTIGRDKKISDESEALLAKTLRINDSTYCNFS